MLPIFFGAATRLASYMLEARKTYRVTATLGIATTTGDAEGAATEDRSHEPPPDAGRVAAAAAAVHRRDRAGAADVLGAEARRRAAVSLGSLRRRGRARAAPGRHRASSTSTATNGRRSTSDVRCSKGTYVRTLVEDVAKAAGTVGHVAALRRLVVDPFDRAGRCRPSRRSRPPQATGRDALDGLLLPADAALPSWPAAIARAGRRGAAGARPSRGRRSPPWPCGHVKVYAESGQFIAIGVVTAERRLAPTRVFIR